MAYEKRPARVLSKIIGDSHRAAIQFSKQYNRWLSSKNQIIFESNITRILSAFNAYFDTFAIDTIDDQEQIVSRLFALVRQHYPEYLMRSGQKELRHRFFQDHMTVYRVLRAYLQVHPEWNQSADIMKLVNVFKVKAASSRLKDFQLRSSYNRNPRSKRNGLIRELAEFTRRVSGKKLMSIYPAIDELLAAVFPSRGPSKQLGNRIKTAYSKRRKRKP